MSDLDRIVALSLEHLKLTEETDCRLATLEMRVKAMELFIDNFADYLELQAGYIIFSKDESLEGIGHICREMAKAMRLAAGRPRVEDTTTSTTGAAR